MNLSWGIPLLILFGIGFLASIGGNIPQEVTGDPISNADTAWMLTAAGLVLLMTPGLSFFYGGMVGTKNVISTMLQSFICLGVISILWIACGFSLAFGESIGGLIGNPLTFAFFNRVGTGTDPSLSPTIPLVLFSLFQLKFAIITPALITGSFAERVKFSGYLLFITLFTLLIYSPLAHWTWHPDGFLRKLGVLDFAGGTVVHMSAGFAALAGAIFMGRRYAHQENSGHQPANIPYVILGTGMLWFGWFGFNAGSALAANGVAAEAFLTTNTASAAAMLAWLFYDGFRGRKPSAMGACIGAVVGLVAITPAAGFVTVGSSILIGAIASVVCNMAVSYRSKTNLDDTLDVFPCHGLGGIIGMLLTAFFAKDVGVIYGQTTTFGYHLLALLIVGIYTFGGSLILYAVTNFFIPLRVPEKEERSGLDLTQHGESVFADGELLESKQIINQERSRVANG